MRRSGLAAALLLLVATRPALSQSGLQAVVHASGFVTPIAIVQDPTDAAVQFVVEQGGRVRVVRGGAVAGDFLDLRAAVLAGGERGLLGMALAPDYPASGRFFVNFTNSAGDTVIARFTRSADPLVADPGSRFDLQFGGARFIDQPYPNHNGGHLAFGPDGYLYVGLGDGGSGNDPEHLAQNPASLLGKMLRIDVSVAASDPVGYRVPADNPFVASSLPGVRREIWSFGLRNPWRYSFDDPARGGTGALVLGDVGQNAYEEINYEPSGRGGRNYGWRNREGAHDNVISRPPAFLPLTEPLLEYPRSDGTSVSGGYVYRGTALGPSFAGRYFYADFVAGRVWSVALNVAGNGEAQAHDLRNHTAELGGTAVLGNISSFGVNQSGELFVLNYSAGRVLRLVNPSVPPSAPGNLRIVR